jgi:hypothetical protein
MTLLKQLWVENGRLTGVGVGGAQRDAARSATRSGRPAVQFT